MLWLQIDLLLEKNIEQLKEEYEERYRTLKAQISESELRTKGELFCFYVLSNYSEPHT